MASLPSQEDLRRRMRAGRVLADITIEELAAKLPAEAEMGERVLRNLENGHTRIKPQALYLIADAIGLPVEWFLVTTIGDLFPAASRSEFETRLARLEAALGAVAPQDSPTPPSAESATPTAAPRTTGRRGPRGSRRKSGQ